MLTIRNALGGALILCALASLTACGASKLPVVRTEIVTVDRDRLVEIDKRLTEPEGLPPYGAGVIRNRDLEEHDRAATDALARANAKLAAIGCVGTAGADGTAALSCLNAWLRTSGLQPQPPSR